jgi:TRAP-type mannitol/chloroaromatic compound transport system permease small subunit
VRGDFLYGSMTAAPQAALDLVLYFAFFLPGILALTWAGWVYFRRRAEIRENDLNARRAHLPPSS